MLANRISQAASILNHGGVIAYSTETILGLGCDPFNESAVKRILWLKSRSLDKGLILLVEDIAYIKKISQTLSEEQISRITNSSNEIPTTWLVPAKSSLPSWITGKQNKVAVRITQHPLSKQLCEACGSIVSTSANYSGQIVTRNKEQIRQWFGPYIDYVLIDAPGTGVASKICDVVSGEVIR